MLRNRLDILLVSCSQAAAMDEVFAEVASAGLPVVVVDRGPRSDENFLTYVCAPDVALGRITAQWLAETLKGKGTIFVLTGTEGTSPAERRMADATEVFRQYPELSVAAVRHTNWREEVGREAMHGLLRENGIPDGVWCDSGLQGAGSIQAFLDSGIPAQRIPPIPAVTSTVCVNSPFNIESLWRRLSIRHPWAPVPCEPHGIFCHGRPVTIC